MHWLSNVNSHSIDRCNELIPFCYRETMKKCELFNLNARGGADGIGIKEYTLWTMTTLDKSTRQIPCFL